MAPEPRAGSGSDLGTRGQRSGDQGPFVPDSDSRFLASYRPDDFPRPSVAVDIAVVTILEGDLRVLLVRRGEHPFRGALALPGGFLRVRHERGDQGEDLDAAARRELEEETGLCADDMFLEQLATFGKAGRDPRMRVISVAYVALVRPDLAARVASGGDARAASFHPIHVIEREPLAFDHFDIVRCALARIKERMTSTSIASSLVAETFTIPELRNVHAIVSGRPQDPGNSRRRFQRMQDDGLIVPATGKRATASKPANTYRFVTHL